MLLAVIRKHSGRRLSAASEMKSNGNGFRGEEVLLPEEVELMSDGSVSTWLERLKDGNEQAATWLWDRYFRRLLGLARARLANLRRQGMADEEDVALERFP